MWPFPSFPSGLQPSRPVGLLCASSIVAEQNFDTFWNGKIMESVRKCTIIVLFLHNKHLDIHAANKPGQEDKF